MWDVGGEAPHYNEHYNDEVCYAPEDVEPDDDEGDELSEVQ